MRLMESGDVNEERPPPVYHHSEFEFEKLRQSSMYPLNRQNMLLTTRR
jgi:hypothetical protein